MDGVAGGNLLSDEYVLLRRAALMVCRVRCRAVAASDEDSPCVMGGMSCCRKGVDEAVVIRSIVFCAMVVMILSGVVLLSIFTCNAGGGAVFS